MMDLQRMKECLTEADVDHSEMSLQEIKSTFVAINSSRNVSMTVDLDSDANIPCADVRSRLGPSSTSTSDTGVTNPSDTGVTQFISTMKGTPLHNKSKFRYKLPKAGAATKITPLKALNDNIHDNVIPCTSTSTTTQLLRSTKPLTAAVRSSVSIAPLIEDNDNDFSALDNGDPRDFPLIIHNPLPRLKKNISAEMAAATAPPPYNDPQYAGLTFQERYDIIGKYMRDMNAYILKLSRLSSKKAPWGKPITSSCRFSGTLDKIPPHVIVSSQISIESDKLNKVIVMEEDSIENSPTSSNPTFDDEPLRSVMESEPTEFDVDEVRSSPRLLRKRKAIRDRSDSLSSNSSIDPVEVYEKTDLSYDEGKKRKKSTVNIKASKSVKSRITTRHIVVDDDSETIVKYTEASHNRKEVTLMKGASRGAGRRQGAGRAKSNTDIMARSSLFKDNINPIVGRIGKEAGTSGKVVSRNRRLIDLSLAEEHRKTEEAKTWNRLKESIVPSTVSDDTHVAQISDDDSDIETPLDKLKFTRVPVRLPNVRSGVPRLARQTYARTEVNATNTGNDCVELVTSSSSKIQEEEQPCPMCNVVFKSSIIEDHAANCEGPESMDTITCSICDRVFLRNTNFEVHSSECIQLAKNL